MILSIPVMNSILATPRLNMPLIKINDLKRTRLYLGRENKKYVLDEQIPTIDDDSTQEEIEAHQKYYDDANKAKASKERLDVVKSLMACKPKPKAFIYAFVLEMKGYFDRLESLNMVFDVELSINIVLSGLPADYNQFVLSYQINGKENSIMELHSLLQTVEQGIKKIDVTSTSAALVLTVSLWKGVVRFGKKGKLAPRYVGPFEIMECVGPVAYRLKLPQELSCVHDTFHVSNLKKCLAEPDVQVPLDEIEIDENLRFVEEPIEIVDRDVKKLKRRRIPLVKVRWNSRQGAEYTWEHETPIPDEILHFISEPRTFLKSASLSLRAQGSSNRRRLSSSSGDEPGQPRMDQEETYANTSPENLKLIDVEAEVIRMILNGIGDDIYSTVDASSTAREMWLSIERLQQGESINKQDVKTKLFWESGKFTSRDGESVESYYSRFYKMINEMVRNKLKVDNMQVNVQFLQQLQPEWSRFMTIVKEQKDLDTISYRTLFDILKEHKNEVNEIRAKRIARNSNPPVLVAVAQHYPDNYSLDTYYQAPKPQKTHAPSSRQTPSTRTHATTSNKGKEIVKLVTLTEPSILRRLVDKEQAQRNKHEGLSISSSLHKYTVDE
ncbi:hypothetical protein Tco_1081910 [Tanacetum coccineum]|uniref:Tf2-1-like SH3-like domain-containing protein n=1 Tax=Tanacetum coccineum TaxID=301880 RepID=A0ABQ5HZA0_9ASTR